ncbi:MAG: hypothetical protein KI792_05350 [Alphaproteobacteria bacterium]|nr:hypothetical protein [Alphaproteobacteria bacterium SS10]
MPRIGVITGLLREADCLSNPSPGRLAEDEHLAEDGVIVASVGGDAKRIKTVIQQLVALGCGGLVSFGIAAGLDRGLEPGDLIAAGTVQLPTGDLIKTNSAWRKRLWNKAKEAEIKLIQGPIVGVEHIVDDPQGKMRLNAATAAIAADMESHIIAYEAMRAGLPFIVVRAIADPHNRVIPPAAWNALTPYGDERVGPVLLGLLRRPHNLPALIQLAGDTKTAISSLAKIGSLDGGMFGFLD